LQQNLILQVLYDKQKEHLVAIGQELLFQANKKDNILKNIVKSDRTLIYAYDI
jgi:hypothetical protein